MYTRRERQRTLAFRRQRRGDERQHHDDREREIDPAVEVGARKEGVGEEPGAAAELDHRGEKSARASEVLRRYDVGDDARERGARRVEEELDPAVADDDLRVVARGGEYQQPR